MKKISMIFLALFLSHMSVYADIVFTEEAAGEKDFSVYYIILGVLVMILIGALAYLKKNKKDDS